MRIAHVLTCGEMDYGREEHVRQVCLWLRRMKMDVTLYLAGEMRVPGVRTIRIPYLRMPLWSEPMRILYMPKPLILRGFDVVHGHSIFQPSYWITLASNTRARIVTEHGHTERLTPLFRAYLSIAASSGRKRKVLFLSVAESVRRQLSWHGVEARMFYNGVDTDYYRPPRSRQSRRILLCVGRIIREKGFQHAVRILRHLDGYRLVVAGPDYGYKRKLLRIAQEEGVLERVFFTGRLPRSMVRKLYRISDLLIHPSSYEGLTLTMLEALSCGLPVVASALSRDLVRLQLKGVVLANPSPEELAEAVLTASENLEALRREARAEALNWAWSKRVRELQLLYISISA